MDKYTVDLDKVLNDFEYTELTDHHVDSNKLIKVDKVEQRSIAGSSNVKHSINNVFHSLNEYINTEISPNCNVNILNNSILNSSQSSINGNPLECSRGIDYISNDLETHHVSHANNDSVEVTALSEEACDITKEKFEDEKMKGLEGEVCDIENKLNVDKDYDRIETDNTNFNSENLDPSSQLIKTNKIKTGEITEVVMDTAGTDSVPNEDIGMILKKADNNKYMIATKEFKGIHSECNKSSHEELREIFAEMRSNPTAHPMPEYSSDSDESVSINQVSTESHNDLDRIEQDSLILVQSDFIQDDDINKRITSFTDISNIIEGNDGLITIKRGFKTENPRRISLKENLKKPVEETNPKITEEVVEKEANISEEEAASEDEDEKEDVSEEEEVDVSEEEVDKASEEKSEKVFQGFSIISSERKSQKTIESECKVLENVDEAILAAFSNKTVSEHPSQTPETSANKDSTSESQDITSENKDTTSENEDTTSDNKETDPKVNNQKEAICYFDDNLVNMDDSELNKYLEELEQEYESQYKNYEQDKTEDAPMTKEEEVNPNVLPSSTEVTDSNKLAEEEMTDSNILDEEEKTDSTVSTEEEKTSITNVKINVIEAVNKEENTNSYSEKEEIMEITLEKVAISEHMEESSDKSERTHSSRPGSLDLGSNPSEAKKSIDLIGEPGSTPYNNVYIAQELPKRDQDGIQTIELDSENSSCTSPTFSNASTETVSSSTESSDIPLEETHHVATTGKEPSVAETHLQPPQFSESVAGGSGQHSAEGGFNGPSISGEALNNTRDDAGAQEVSSGATTERADEGNASGGVEMSATSSNANWIGKQAPVWVPDSDAMNCMLCDMKFTVIKRRHHCRACGRVICSKCSSFKYKLEYLEAEARVCVKCYDLLNKDTSSSSLSDISIDTSNPSRRNQPNPNNPLEYCSTVPPLQQMQGATSPPAVLVPVGVLKRKGSNKMRTNKSVMFCDGIRPGSDLTNLDNDFNYSDSRNNKKGDKQGPNLKSSKNFPLIDPETKSFIPNSDNNLPPTVSIHKTDVIYTECANNTNVIEMLKNETLTFALQKNLFVHLKIINMSCCINKTAWCFTTEGLITVGQDEIVILLEYIEDETMVPRDVFMHINFIYTDAVKGNSVKEMGLSVHNTSNFLDSKNHAGFVFIKPTFQCLQNVIIPKETYLIGILIHRWETPWAKLFPLRLILRLGAEYRYYPSPIISTRYRDSVFVEVGHTIINLLADFRNYSYTLPQIRGLTIHMEGKNTTVTIPSNRYDQVMKNMNNSSDHILAFAGNFSQEADSHLVCIQDTQSNDNSYSTHSINIHNKARKVTGVSFIVFNGALKSSSGLTAKSSIVEDGLMIQIPPDHMVQIRDSLRNMKNHVIQCGCLNAATDETINIIWGEPDITFNIGVVSPIDGQSMSGMPSIRVHNGKDFLANSGNRLIRWTEVFILQNAEETSRNQDPVDISKVSESISKATCQALVKYLDLLASNNFYKIGIRATLHVENVSYAAGGNSVKLPPIYMKSLDNELIPVLHRITSNNLGENIIVLELIFRVLNV